MYVRSHILGVYEWLSFDLHGYTGYDTVRKIKVVNISITPYGLPEPFCNFSLPPAACSPAK